MNFQTLLGAQNWTAVLILFTTLMPTLNALAQPIGPRTARDQQPHSRRIQAELTCMASAEALGFRAWTKEEAGYSGIVSTPVAVSFFKALISSPQNLPEDQVEVFTFTEHGQTYRSQFSLPCKYNTGLQGFNNRGCLYPPNLTGKWPQNVGRQMTIALKTEGVRINSNGFSLVPGSDGELFPIALNFQHVIDVQMIHLSKAFALADAVQAPIQYIEEKDKVVETKLNREAWTAAINFVHTEIKKSAKMIIDDWMAYSSMPLTDRAKWLREMYFNPGTSGDIRKVFCGCQNSDLPALQETIIQAQQTLLQSNLSVDDLYTGEVRPLQMSDIGCGGT